MATPPSEIRTGLTLVTTAAVAEVAEVANSYVGVHAQQSALFVAAPIIVSTYMDGSAALALDWYDELRDEADLLTEFVPQPVTNLREDYIGNVVGWATKPLVEPVPDFDLELATAEMLAKIEAEIQKEVATAFRDTMLENVANDPSAVGWQRFARPDACRFCRLLADKGAIYRANNVRFAAHTDCHCLAAPVFDGQPGEKADVWQYVASQRQRTDEERKALRDYLNKKYGTDSPARADRGSARETSAPRDVDANKSTAELEATLASLERSLARFESPGTRRRIEDLRRKIRARTN